MNKYKVTLSGFLQEVINADRIQYTEVGFVLFYVGTEIIAAINKPLSVVKKP